MSGRYDHLVSSFSRLPVIKMGVSGENREVYSDQTSTPLLLETHSIHVSVKANTVQTTHFLTFVNSTSKTLEGEMIFPLPKDSSVHNFGLDINGVIVDAVPVEKEAARVAFETTVRERGAAVSVAEKVDATSNVFKTKVYPMPANGGKRTVKVVVISRVIDSADQQMSYLGITKAKGLNELSFSYETNQESSYVLVKRSSGDLEKVDPTKDIKSSADIEGILLVVPKPSEVKKNDGVVFVEKDPESGYHYFSATFSGLEDVLKGKKIEKIDRKMSIFYDVSSSRKTSQWKHELEFLHEYLKKYESLCGNPLEIEVSTFSCIVHEKRVMRNALEVIKFLTEQRFDGGTCLPIQEISEVTDSQFVLLFTDGISNFGKDMESQLFTSKFSTPIFCFSSAPKSSYLMLRYLGRVSGGGYFDLSEETIEEVLEKTSHERNTLRNVICEPGDSVDEIFCSEVVNYSITVYGRILNPEKEPVVRLDFGGDVFEVRILMKYYSHEETKSSLLRTLWAQLKIDMLSIFPTKNKKLILDVGLKYGICTDNTSLIVLSELSQYKKHNICPPKSLKKMRKEYLNGIEEEEKKEEVRRKEKLEKVLAKWEKRVKWHKRDFKVEIEGEKKRKQKEEEERQKREERKRLRLKEEEEKRKKRLQQEKKKMGKKEASQEEQEDGESKMSHVRSIFDLSFELKFRSKRLEKDANRMNRDIKKEKMKVKRYMERGDPETARIFAENAVRKKNEQKNMYRIAARIGAISSQIEGMKRTTSSDWVKKVLRGIDFMSRDLDILTSMLDKFELRMEDMSVTSGYTSTALQSSSSSIDDPSQDAETIMREVSEEHGLVLQLGSDSHLPIPKTSPSIISSSDDLEERLRRLQDISGDPPEKAVRTKSTKIRRDPCIFMVGTPRREDIPKDTQENQSPENVSSSVIKVKAFKKGEEYLEKIRKSKKPYEEYLLQKPNYEDSPSFFLDSSDYFFSLYDTKKDEELLSTGIRILSNVVELELNNVQLHRIVGYRLDQAKRFDEAIFTFEKVLKEKPEEPQSYRDLALVLEKKGEEYVRAAELLWSVVTMKIDSRFDEIELTAVLELNHVLNQIKDEEERKEVVKRLFVDERFLYQMDLDLRVSMAWDTDMTDIDLHVYDPTGEHCYYSHKYLKEGGLLSRDFVRGYGPEEFMQRKVLTSGKFRVSAKYFASHQQALTGGTTILCSFFTDYLRENEKAEMVTLRLNRNKEEINVCEIGYRVK